MKHLTVLIVFLISMPTFAHHNVLARFDGSTEITLTGIVTNFDWKNPHIEIFIDVEDADGNVTNWVLPTAAPVVATRSGITPETVVPGDTLVVTGWPARNGANEMRAWVMTLEDGTSFQLSPVPKGVTREQMQAMIAKRGTDQPLTVEEEAIVQQSKPLGGQRTGGVDRVQMQAIIAKRRSGQSLTTEEEAILQQFQSLGSQQTGGVDRAQMQAIIAKRRNGESLTTEEEVLLQQFQQNIPPTRP
jgi:uncharacterized protein (UPF0335 family)